MSRRKNDLSQRLEAVIKTLVPQQEQNPDDLGPMMRAIKAVHSISDHTSTTLSCQRAASVARSSPAAAAPAPAPTSAALAAVSSSSASRPATTSTVSTHWYVRPAKATA